VSSALTGTFFMSERLTVSTLRDPAALALADARLDGLIDICNRALTGHNGRALQMRPQGRRRRTNAYRLQYFLQHGKWLS
jgi:hypothetical protein